MEKKISDIVKKYRKDFKRFRSWDLTLGHLEEKEKKEILKFVDWAISQKKTYKDFFNSPRKYAENRLLEQFAECYNIRNYYNSVDANEIIRDEEHEKNLIKITKKFKKYYGNGGYF